MALVPTNQRHAAQIAAGTAGRRRGHDFEKRLAEDLNLIDLASLAPGRSPHLTQGDPAVELLRYVIEDFGRGRPERVQALWLGGLATDRAGDLAARLDGSKLSASKSDVLLRMSYDDDVVDRSVSVKTCNNAKPTNAQLYFTTAVAFCGLLRTNGIPVDAAAAEAALRRFCGDVGFRPSDDPGVIGRASDPARWYWEELPTTERRSLERLFTGHQDAITRVLLKYAYPGDPFPPDYVLHQRSRAATFEQTPLALCTVEELVAYSRAAGSFVTRTYRIRKGTWKDDPNEHLAPRFGFVQFQRGGQKQHPTQLQFNLAAGYFNRLASP